MTDLLFDRYKDALRAGHVAVLRGQLDDALSAYRRAAEVAPTRALPHTSMGGVLLDLDRVDEALEELRIALELAPGDEVALLGRAEALTRAGRPAEAAATLDQLADSQLDTGRIADAVDTLQRALGLEERVGRRRKYQRAIRTVRMQSGERSPDDLGVVGVQPAAVTAVDAEPGPEAGPEQTPEPGTGPEAENEPELGPEQEPQAGPEAENEPELGPEQEPRVGPEAEPEPRIAGDAILAAAERAALSGDVTTALAGYLEAAGIFETAGLYVAALDACREALTIAPGDLDAHMRYASICRARGWRELAQARLVNVLRLADLEGDAEGRARVHALVESEFVDDEQLLEMSA